MATLYKLLGRFNGQIIHKKCVQVAKLVKDPGKATYAQKIYQFLSIHLISRQKHKARLVHERPRIYGVNDGFASEMTARCNQIVVVDKHGLI